MNTRNQTPKTDKRQQAHAEFMKVLENASTRGFHGTASVTVHVQDGHVQYTRVNVERMIK